MAQPLQEQGAVALSKARAAQGRKEGPYSRAAGQPAIFPDWASRAE